MIAKLGIFTGVLLLLGFPTLSVSQPHLSGNLSGTLGPGDYIVDGDCFIPAGNTLTILPGTTFLHSGNYVWLVYGELTANGTADDSVSFIRQFPTPECRWAGIRFMEGSSASSRLNYCIIDYCYQTEWTSLIYGAGIYVQLADITISHTRVSNCTSYSHGGGIYAENANVTIEYCLIVNNLAPAEGNGGGIYLENCLDALIRNCEIAYNTDTGG